MSLIMLAESLFWVGFISFVRNLFAELRSRETMDNFEVCAPFVFFAAAATAKYLFT